jgi:hypothetical protein
MRRFIGTETGVFDTGAADGRCELRFGAATHCPSPAASVLARIASVSSNDLIAAFHRMHILPATTFRAAGKVCAVLRKSGLCDAKSACRSSASR